MQEELINLKTNNALIIATLKSLCDILREHNKRFTITSAESNIEVGAALHAPKEAAIHTFIVNAIENVLVMLDKPTSIPEACHTLRSALESSVLLAFMI